MKKSIFLGILASFFFASSFILNSSMNIGGGNWMWSAALRYIFTLPLLFCIVRTTGAKKVLTAIRQSPTKWILWSTVGFGLFYAPLTFAAAYGQSWLIAGCWQITIICGILLTPLFKQPIPVKSLVMSIVIIIGVGFIQYEHASDISLQQALLSILPIIVGAFSYPLGNRKMMQVCNGNLSTTERIFGMTLCSMPFWLILSLCALRSDGFPSQSQLVQSFIVALSSGVIATVLFFKATDLVKHNANELGIVEATQSFEVIFTLLGEILILGGTLPSATSLIGLSLIIIGMIGNSLLNVGPKDANTKICE